MEAHERTCVDRHTDSRYELEAQKRVSGWYMNKQTDKFAGYEAFVAV